jgi:hypothetical protein
MYVIKLRCAPPLYLGRSAGKRVEKIEEARTFTEVRHAKSAIRVFTDWEAQNLVRDGLSKLLIVPVRIEETSIPYPVPVDL